MTDSDRLSKIKIARIKSLLFVRRSFLLYYSLLGLIYLLVRSWWLARRKHEEKTLLRHSHDVAGLERAGLLPEGERLTVDHDGVLA